MEDTMDHDKLIGKKDNQIRQAEIEAYHRGKDDHIKSGKLAVEKLRKNMSDKAILSIVQDYAHGHHVEQICLKTGLDKAEILSILKTLDIETGAQARRFLDEQSHLSLDDQAERKRKHVEAQARLDEQNKKLVSKKPTPVSPKQISHKNKLDKVRQLLSTKVNKTTFKVAVNLELDFKSLVVYGLNAIRRKFGEQLTDKEIKAEIKRLLPGVNVDLVRP